MSVTFSILITGAYRGFGRALTGAYLNAGARVFPLVRKQSHAEELADVDRGHCVPLVGNVRHDAVTETIRHTLSASGGTLDMLVNNAGESGRGMKFDTLGAADLLSQFDLHCAGALRCTRAAFSFLERSGRGTVVNLSSRLGSLQKNASGELVQGAYSYDYRIAKAAQNMLTLCLNQELSPRGVAVCALHPGRLRTDSGSADADTDADTAAARFVRLFDELEGTAGGRFFDLGGGELPW